MPVNLDLKAIKQGLMLKNDEQLVDILSFNQEDYRPEVILIIKEVLIERGFDNDKIETANNKYQNIIKDTSPSLKNQKRITGLPKFLIFLMWLAGLAMLKFIIGLFSQGALTSFTHK